MMLPTSVSASITTSPGPMTAKKVFHPGPEIRDWLRILVARSSIVAIRRPSGRGAPDKSDSHLQMRLAAAGIQIKEGRGEGAPLAPAVEMGLGRASKVQ